MFTQCPQCSTVFRVTATMLKAAQGRVRCGRCNNIFSALTFLIEQEPAVGPAPQELPAEPASTSAQADRQAPADADDLPYDPERFNSDDIPESALEFDLAADQLTNVFVEAPAPSITVTHGSRPPLSDADDDTAEHEIIEIEVIEPQGREDITLEGDHVDSVVIEEEFAAAALAESETEYGSGLQAQPKPAADQTERGEFILPSGTRVRLDGGDEPDQQSNPDSSDPDPASDESGLYRAIAAGRPAKRPVSRLWTVASVSFAVLLAAQIIHFNRQTLIRNPLFGPALGRLYAAFGLELTPAWDLQAYQLRQWGAAADPGTNGTLRVRASLYNGADHAQPYPLLRLILQDRFGSRVGLRDLQPREYLQTAPAERQLLGAGERIDAEIAIVDPGQDAVGFEIDVCLQGSGHHVSCASDQPQQPG